MKHSLSNNSNGKTRIGTEEKSFDFLEYTEKKSCHGYLPIFPTQWLALPPARPMHFPGQLQFSECQIGQGQYWGHAATAVKIKSEFEIVLL